MSTLSPYHQAQRESGTGGGSGGGGSVLYAAPPRPITRRIVSDRDHPTSIQSLPANGTVGPSLWNAVRSRVRVSAALREGSQQMRRSRMFDDERRVDDEGLTSDTLRSDVSHLLAPGQYAEQWQSLAHLFEPDSEGASSRATPKRKSKRSSVYAQAGPSRSVDGQTTVRARSILRGRQSNQIEPNPDDSLLSSSFPAPSSLRGDSSIKLRSRRSQDPSPSQHGQLSMDASKPARNYTLDPVDRDGLQATADPHRHSISEEPISMLNNDPEQTPLGEDPLSYSTQDQLLDSDSDSDSDSEEEVDTSESGDDADGGGAIDQVNANNPKPASDASAAPEMRSTPSFVARLKQVPLKIRSWLRDELVFTTLQRNIIKCALAYFIASLFTYSPWLSRWMASFLPNDDPDGDVPFSNLHMIATVAVYFHPAKTLGAMLEADFFALVAFLYAVALGFCSMAVAVFLHETNRLIISDIVSVLIFLGVGMALVGYAKIKVAKAQFNTACSLVSIIVFTVLVKEGSLHLGHFSTEKTFQVTLVVIAGSFIANLVCFTIWPQSATTNLQSDIVRNLRGFSTLLRVLTKTFLLEDPSNFHFKSDRIKRAIDDHYDSFTSLKKNLAEAKLESLFDMRMRGLSGKYVEATDSLNRLAQHLAGLRSSCGLQHQIMMARKEAERAAREEEQDRRAAAESDQDSRPTGQPKSTVLSDVFRQSAVSPARSDASQLADTSALMAAETTAFEDFIASVGPHMRSLVFSCCRTLKGLRSTFVSQSSTDIDWSVKGFNRDDQSSAPFGTTDFHNYDSTKAGYVPGTSFEGLDTEITAALNRFQHEQTAAIKRIYTMEPKRAQDSVSEDTTERFQQGFAFPSSSATLQKYNPDEEIFLIFFFVFNLEEFAKELENLIEALEAIRQAEERIALAKQTSWWMRTRLFFGTFSSMKVEYRGFLRNSKKSRQTAPKKITTALDFPSNRRHAVNTHQTPTARTFREKLQRLMWTLGEFFRQPDTKFAIKAGAGSALLATPAFFPSTRHMFTKFQGQWALVSFMVVLSPTVGQSNHMSLHRIGGTILGALTAVAMYTIFPDNNVALPIFGLLFSIPCFKVIVGKPQLASSGRFVLLTYNLTALYSYNLRKTGIEVDQIAYQRTVSVIIGVLWATILNQLVWPFEARRQLALGVSDVLFKLAWLYQRLVLSYSEDPTRDRTGEPANLDEELADSFDADDDEETALLGSGASRQRDEFQAIELHLQVSLIKLEGLLAQTKHEPRLKGPFPVATYKAMLSCCQNILDKLHSMRCVTGRQDWYRHVRRDFVVPVNAERREMVGNILLFFYTLGSAFHLKSPVPPYFPPAGDCRVRLLDKIRELPVVKRRAVRGSSAYLLFYSYALAMKDVIDQLEELGRLTQRNFGVWGGSVEDFERHFVANEQSVNPTPIASQKPSRSDLRR